MRRLVTALLVSVAPAAAAQDVFTLLGVGAEAKARAGAGQLGARAAPASYYNPANLAEAPVGWEPYVAVDVMSLRYVYEYPGFDPVTVATTTPIPFLGLGYRPEALPWLSVAGSYLPIPGGSGGSTIKKLPSRKFGSLPTVVDVETKGEGLGHRASLGVGVRVMSGLAFGVSLLSEAHKGGFEARDSETGEPMARDTTDFSQRALLLGARGQALQGQVTGAFTVRPPAKSRAKGRTEVPGLGPTAAIDRDGTSEGPLGLGLGVEARVWEGLSPFFEVTRESWAALRSQKEYAGLTPADVDLYDTTNVVFGAAWKDGPTRLTAAYGVYQSHLGPGIMASEADDEREVVGMEFEDLGGVARTVYAVGYERVYPRATVQAALSYLAGARELPSTSRGYGSYRLRIVSFALGWAHRL